MTNASARPMRGLYILDGRIPVATADVLRWGDWFEGSDAERRVALTKLPFDDGEVGSIIIRTAFTAIDMGFRNTDRAGYRPLLWETRTQCGELYDYDRYYSWEDAEAGHIQAVKRAHEAIVAMEKMARRTMASFSARAEIMEMMKGSDWRS